MTLTSPTRLRIFTLPNTSAACNGTILTSRSTGNSMASPLFPRKTSAAFHFAIAKSSGNPQLGRRHRRSVPHAAPFRSLQDPEQQRLRRHRDSQENNSSLAMKVSMQIAGVHTRPKDSDGDDAQRVLRDRKRNGGCDQQSLPPARTQKQLRQDHRDQDQHHARANAAAFGGDLDIEIAHLERVIFLCHRDVFCVEEQPYTEG